MFYCGDDVETFVFFSSDASDIMNVLVGNTDLQRRKVMLTLKPLEMMLRGKTYA